MRLGVVQLHGVAEVRLRLQRLGVWHLQIDSTAGDPILGTAHSAKDNLEVTYLEDQKIRKKDHQDRGSHLLVVLEEEKRKGHFFIPVVTTRCQGVARVVVVVVVVVTIFSVYSAF